MDVVSLPSEVWLQIHRLATSDTSPMVKAQSEAYRYVSVTDPLMDMHEFLRDALSFALVCRLWNSLANEILYENIRVDGRFHTLSSVLQRTGATHLVRSVRLSPTRFDHNYAILALCTRLQVIVLPEIMPVSLEEHVACPNLDVLQFPEYRSLKQMYWTESAVSAALLRRLIPVAPNLEYLYIQSANLRADQILDLPAIPRLRRLGLGRLHFPFVYTMDLQNLTRLTCPASLPNMPQFPVFPSLRTLELFGSRTTLSFKIIFSRCPRLRELCYDVWNSPVEPEEAQAQPPLTCIRLQSAVTVVREWALLEAHFGLFLSPKFPRLQRLVLHGSWHRVVDTALFTSFRDGLQAQGCQIEFPEGHVR
ncbi:hypothetical protein DFH06DRAFT_185200 [Mycena polygramma]|nr:hypothetical protein DFH06DRAFT_185200 [Mycena polygramma]